MSPRTKFQLEQLRSETHTTILQSALLLFAKNGFDRTSVDDVATASKISKGLVYYYFKSKDEILDTLIRQMFDDIITIEQQIPDDTPPEDVLRIWIVQSLEQLKTHPTQWKLFFSIMFQPSLKHKIGMFVQQYRAEALTKMEHLFAQLGSPSPLVDSMILGCLLDGIGLNYMLAPEEIQLDVLLNRITETISHLYKENKC